MGRFVRVIPSGRNELTARLASILPGRAGAPVERLMLGLLRLMLGVAGAMERLIVGVERACGVVERLMLGPAPGVVERLMLGPPVGSPDRATEGFGVVDRCTGAFGEGARTAGRLMPPPESREKLGLLWPFEGCAGRTVDTERCWLGELHEGRGEETEGEL